MNLRRRFFLLLPAVLVALVCTAACSANPKKTPTSPAAAPGAGVATAAGAPRSDYRFAVKEFRVADTISYPGWYGYQAGLNSAVCDMLTTEMSKQGRDMVERERLEDVTSEQDLGTGGRLDRSTAAPVGKIVGADYLILGTITEWGIKDRSLGGGGIFGGMFGGAGYRDTTASVKIDYHVVNAKTGRIVSGSAGTAMGEDASRGLSLQKNWWSSINFSESEWTSSQIGKATRKCVQQIAQQLADWTPNDGGAEPDRPALKASVVALVSPTEFVIDQGQSSDVRVGDTLDVIRFKAVKNASGKVVYRSETKIGSATVTEVQPDGARLRIVGGDTAPKVKEGDGVRTPASASGGR